MNSVLLDTHAWAWSLTGDRRLSNLALKEIGSAENVFVSPISFFEIGQKVRLGKWPEMTPFVDTLPSLLLEQGGWPAAMDPEICLFAATIDWDHRDPFDRLLAATSLRSELPIVSADAVFDELDGLKRIW